MPTAPVTRMNKKLVDYLGTHTCKHGHTYLEHYNCYLEEHQKGEKVGYFDIECTNLNADYGMVLCWCIKEGGKDKIIRGVLQEKDVKKCLDRNVVKSCLEALGQFDRIFTYYGTKFDIPYIKARALIHGLPIDNLAFGTRYHKDLYYVARRSLKISSRRLENVAKVVLGKTQKTRLDPPMWTKAAMGDKESLKYVVKHCDYDVIDLELVHHKLEPLYIMRDTSV
jgi:uncharacterized protein YprB with RNaseH-like and TPR domain